MTPLEEDIVFALSSLECVSQVIALDPPSLWSGTDPPYVLAIALQPHDGATLARTHAALSKLLPKELVGRTLYFDPRVGAPRPAQRGRVLSLSATARADAAKRATGYSPPAAWQHDVATPVPWSTRRVAVSPLRVAVIVDTELELWLEREFGHEFRSSLYLAPQEAIDALTRVSEGGVALQEEQRFDLILCPLREIWVHAALRAWSPVMAERLVFVAPPPESADAGTALQARVLDVPILKRPFGRAAFDAAVKKIAETNAALASTLSRHVPTDSELIAALKKRGDVACDRLAEVFERVISPEQGEGLLEEIRAEARPGWEGREGLFPETTEELLQNCRTMARALLGPAAQ